MPAASDYPVLEPLFTGCLVDEIMAAREEEGPRAQAADTLFRYSSAGSCARKLSLYAAGVEESNPADEAGAWVMYLGNIIHERVQAAIERRFPNSKAEVKSVHGRLTSGHADELIRGLDISAVVAWQGGDVLYELKTKGGTAFANAIGVERFRGGKWKDDGPSGPGIGAKRQGALNAHALGCDTLCVAYLATEAISKGVGDKLGLTARQRYMAEWWYSEDEWRPWADAELDRLHRISQDLVAGHFSERQAVDDDGTIVKLNPDLQRPDWRCQYCSHLDVCIRLGPGTPAVRTEDVVV